MPAVRPIAALVGLALIAGAILYVRSRRTASTDQADLDEITVTAGRITEAPAGTLDFVDVWASRLGALVMSRGYRNNNPGNIRYIARNPWRGQVADDKGYGIYDTKEHGTRALGKQLLVYARRGLVTVGSIISTWAPTNENDTRSYIAAVSAALEVDADDTLDVRARLPKLARAIAKHENGYIDSSYDFESWVYLP